MGYYIGVAKCCGNVTAALVDDQRTTAKEVGEFAHNVVSSGREFKHVDTLDKLTIRRCKCNAPSEEG